VALADLGNRELGGIGMGSRLALETLDASERA